MQVRYNTHTTLSHCRWYLDGIIHDQRRCDSTLKPFSLLLDFWTAPSTPFSAYTAFLGSLKDTIVKQSCWWPPYLRMELYTIYKYVHNKREIAWNLVLCRDIYICSLHSRFQRVHKQRNNCRIWWETIFQTQLRTATYSKSCVAHGPFEWEES